MFVSDDCRKLQRMIERWANASSFEVVENVTGH